MDTSIEKRGKETRETKSGGGGGVGVGGFRYKSGGGGGEQGGGRGSNASSTKKGDTPTRESSFLPSHIWPAHRKSHVAGRLRSSAAVKTGSSTKRAQPEMSIEIISGCKDGLVNKT
jgi:hypothetical protein